MKYDIKQIVEGLKAIALGSGNRIDYINIQNNEEILRAANDLLCLSDNDRLLIDTFLNKRGWNHRNALTPRSGVDLYNLACRIEKINEMESMKKNNELEVCTPTLPYLNTCEKCGGTDISRHYRKQGEKWDKLLGQSEQWETEHAIAGLVYNEAKKECITHHCRTCSYDWTTDVLNKIKETKYGITRNIISYTGTCAKYTKSDDGEACRLG